MADTEKKKVEIKISGMHCATCAVNIEESLTGLKDVTKAQVNFGTDTAHVEYDPAKVSLATLEKAVKEVGYEVINS
jgi:Cu+-exporting ATPase